MKGNPVFGRGGPGFWAGFLTLFLGWALDLYFGDVELDGSRNDVLTWESVVVVVALDPGPEC